MLTSDESAAENTEKLTARPSIEHVTVTAVPGCGATMNRSYSSVIVAEGAPVDQTVLV